MLVLRIVPAVGANGKPLQKDQKSQPRTWSQKQPPTLLLPKQLHGTSKHSAKLLHGQLSPARTTRTAPPPATASHAPRIGPLRNFVTAVGAKGKPVHKDQKSQPRTWSQKQPRTQPLPKQLHGTSEHSAKLLHGRLGPAHTARTAPPPATASHAPRHTQHKLDARTRAGTATCRRLPGGCSSAAAISRHSPAARGDPVNPKALIELKWPADRNDSSTGCVVGIGTADNLASDTYGGYSSETTINWAAAHGYSYSLFVHGYSLNTTEDKARLFWAKPQVMRNMLERPTCAWVMYLDGDAVINQPRFSVEEKLLRFLAPAVPAVRVLLTCHSPFGDSDDCLPCKCCRAGDCPASARAKPAPGDGSVVNAGVVLVRNDPTAREMVRWWANAGDGECDAHSYFGEQNCLGRMQRRWVNQIDVVSAAVMNAPIWYNPANWNVTTIQEYKLVRQTVKNNSSRPLCLSSDLFICHAYAMKPAPRVVSFRTHHATVVEPLRHLLARRGRTYAEQPAWTAWKRHTPRAT